LSKIEAKNVWKIYNGDVIAVEDLNFCCEDGEFMAILGPSGCGKSSTLRMIAGLEEITRGELLFDEKVVNDLSPNERNIALAFESYALYPPLTVYGNIAFPLQARGMKKGVVDKKVKQVAEWMDLTDLLDRKPANLSGGQQQRVSLARALVRDPNLFLLDEPISHMDQRVRSVLRARIKRIHEDLGATTIYVTHDQEEAIALADKVLVMNLGVVNQVGTIDELFNHPVNKFVAGFLGEPAMNFINGKIEKPQEVSISTKEGRSVLPLRKKVAESHVGSNVTVGIRPEKITVSQEKREQEGTSVPAKIEIIEPLGEKKILTVKLDGEELKAVVPWEVAKLDIKPEQNVWLNFKQEDINVFDYETENSLLD